MNADPTTADGPPDAGADIRREDRLAALRQTGLLDTPPEEVFDRVTRLARRLLRAPVILVSLVDADRQFFKGAVGLPEPWATRRETPLSHSFCQHVVATGAPFRVEDARQHALVRDNPAVSELGVVAYLGTPLATADGRVLGSLCAIDTEPRTWTTEDIVTLRDLAGLVMSEVSLRRVALKLETRLGEEVAAREAAQARLARTRQLEALGQVAGGAAHDFANVLQAVQGGVRLAAGRLDRDTAAVPICPNWSATRPAAALSSPAACSPSPGGGNSASAGWTRRRSSKGWRRCWRTPWAAATCGSASRRSRVCRRCWPIGGSWKRCW